MPPEFASVRAVFVDQLKDLYSAETLIAKALPKLVKAARSPDLKNALKHHLTQTREHAARLRQICAALREKPTGKTCQATVGLLKEGDEAMAEDALPEMKDLMLIAAARRTEHYEIAGYTSACAAAKALGLKEILATLQATLAEEKAMDATLARSTNQAFSRAFTAEKAVQPDEGHGLVAEVERSIKRVVAKVI